MPPYTLRAIVFDAVGTLIHPDPPAAEVYAAVGKRFGGLQGREEIGRRFAKAFAREEEADEKAHFQTSENREAERWRRVVREVLEDAADAEACFQELFRHFGQPSAWRCEAGAGVVLEQLVRRGYALGLASNFDCRLRNVVAGMPGLAPIQHLIISSEVGWRKPAPRFYEAVCSSLGLPPGEVLYIGDNLSNDYQGALAGGLRALLFDPRGRGGEADRIGSLAELLEMLQ